MLIIKKIYYAVILFCWFIVFKSILEKEESINSLIVLKSMIVTAVIILIVSLIPYVIINFIRIKLGYDQSQFLSYLLITSLIIALMLFFQ